MILKHLARVRSWAIALTLTLSSVAVAENVAVVASGFSGAGSEINSFYNSFPAHNSTLYSEESTEIDTLDLSNIQLLWVIQPSAALTGNEISTLSSFLASGGRIAFMGEHGGGGFAAAENDRIDAAVAALGGHMQIDDDNALDGGYHVASKVNGQILDHTLTAGVDTYEYAAFAPLINLAPPAETLMLGTDLTSVMMAFENIGAGSIFLITDQNVTNFSGTYNNDIMFTNLLTGITGAPPPTPPGPAVPVPVMGVWGIGILSTMIGLLGMYSRRRV